jgi:hypothetical protein
MLFRIPAQDDWGNPVHLVLQVNANGLSFWGAERIPDPPKEQDEPVDVDVITDVPMLE